MTVKHCPDVVFVSFMQVSASDDNWVEGPVGEPTVGDEDTAFSPNHLHPNRYVQCTGRYNN